MNGGLVLWSMNFSDILLLYCLIGVQ